MAFDYSGLAGSAKTLIQRFGRQVTLERSNRAPADPDKPWRGNVSAPDETLVWAAIVPTEFMAEEGRLPQRGEMTALVPADSTYPDLSDYDTIVDGSVRWAIRGVEIVEPGDTRLLYMFSVER